MNEEPKSGVAEFRKGDMPPCDACGTASCVDPKTGNAMLTSLSVGPCHPCAACWEESGSKNASDIRARRAELRHEPAEEQKFYMTQPEKLPKTLPAGTRWNATSADSGVLLAGSDPLSGSGWYCPKTRDNNGDMRTANLWNPAWVDWATVPLPASTPPAQKDSSPARAETKKGSPVKAELTESAEPVRGDPYAEHREQLSRDIYGVSGAETCVAVALRQAELDAKRLSAMTLRERRKSEALRMLDRPLPVRSGALLDRDKYGQRVALHGWSEDAEYEGQV